MRVLLDTNIIISAILFGGKPRTIHLGVMQKRYHGVTSMVLLSELADVLRKKFRFSRQTITITIGQMKKHYEVVLPMEEIAVLADQADNRVLEAAAAGACDVIVTGDRELLHLQIFRGIRIVTAKGFLDHIDH